MIGMSCRYCSSINIITKNNGPHIGAYCADCGKWLKWLSKSEKLSMSTPTFPTYAGLLQNNENDDEEVPW